MGEKFKVSRTVVREAIRSLTARGLIRVTSGRGAEVNEMDRGAATLAEAGEEVEASGRAAARRPEINS